MAVVLKINPGFDTSYPWREIGTGARREPASGLDYYLAPADKGGEPAGRWAGRGLATLNLAAGQVIDRNVFEPLYGQHLNPGFDASYPWREIGTGAQPASPALDYYLPPPTRAANPQAGGPGAAWPPSGFTAGQVIDRAVFEPLYGQHLDPRDPAWQGPAGPGRPAVHPRGGHLHGAGGR